MRRIKYTIIYIAGLLVLSLSISLVFAAFVFNQVSDITGEFGKITIEEKNFFDYSYDKTSADKDVAKLRKDTVAIIDGIILSANESYTSVSGSQIFMNGITYYKKVGNNYESLIETTESVEGDYNVGELVSTYAGTVYIQTKTYTGISSISKVQYYDSTNSRFENISKTINGSVITFTVGGVSVTITCTIEADGGYISTATITASNDKNYRVQLDVDGLGMLVLDTDITNTLSTGYSVLSDDAAITCSASEDKYYTAEEKEAHAVHPYLSQIGLHFKFKSEIAVYVRIRIRDAWEKIKEYPTSSRESYTIKDQVSGQSPFTVNDSAWYYDADTNCVYLKQMYVPEYNAQGQLISQEYTFNVNEAYFYQVASTTAYTEYVNVEVSFTIDIVQANRAKTLWKLDPSQIGNE